MRITRMRAMAAGVLGAALISVATPASATTPEPTPTTSATPTATPTPDTTGDILGGTPTPTGTPTAEATASLDPSATPSVDPSATPSADPSATPGIDVTTTTTGTPSPTPRSGTGDPILDGFLSLLPFKVPLDKEIDGIEDFDANPLVLTFTCGASGPEWTLRNTSDKALGFGWFDTSLGAGISEIGPGQSLPLQTHAMAVIASPWDAETGYLLVTVPTVGVSDCAGTAPPVDPQVSLPVADPAVATAVRAEPYYTR
ncbi:hypothetical protein MXD62_18380 [Frankia sp. Mgl5]|uniref:hypothetical protein n=1 Tax=Frankia sp. Mgl5 TaxID=2933793 RepID=UPI00200DCB7D|nr:hypothetical protein [Frankia sp. Mgl5]MCK9929117.1 hypothetical protein [Frankia sp. Mgl5]